MADVVGARRGLDRAREKRAVAQGRFEAAIVSTVDHDLPEFEEKIEYLSRFVGGEGEDA